MFHRTLDHYRSQGYLVAVDDAGAGYSGLTSVAQIRPEFIKIDMSLIQGIDKDPVKRALIETFVSGYLSTQYRDLFAFGILIAMLVIRPSGIMGKNTEDKA